MLKCIKRDIQDDAQPSHPSPELSTTATGGSGVGVHDARWADGIVHGECRDVAQENLAEYGARL